MKNITLAIDEELLIKSRDYAKKHNMSLNAMVRTLLEKTVEKKAQSLENCFRLMDRLNIKSSDDWTREDLYDV